MLAVDHVSHRDRAVSDRSDTGSELGLGLNGAKIRRVWAEIALFGDALHRFPLPEEALAFLTRRDVLLHGPHLLAAIGRVLTAGLGFWCGDDVGKPRRGGLKPPTF